MIRHVFGPVPSRRLGRSLGVDLVPFKTCTYDCIYCQLGRTNHKTTEIREWVSLDDVLGELDSQLSSRPDYITLSGSGEPTLFSKTGDLIAEIKSMTEVPIAVLTNGSLLYRKEVREQLMRADVVIPSLDVGDPETFRFVNRPHPKIEFDDMLQGLIDLRLEFAGQYWLESLLLDGVTSSGAALEDLQHCVERIVPDRVQLNTVARPPAEATAVGVPRDRLVEIATEFEPTCEVVSDSIDTHTNAELSSGYADVLGMLRRRPCTVEDISSGLKMHRAEVVKYVAMLERAHQIETRATSNKTFYRALSFKEVNP
jgi:wyosine [tRNA(Phe)-imidazoG37] synthetase (radical SAM superfamily)